ncbi:uncharacterized protein N7506_003444 [Penicillium brevicompactum]|uniref:uncharacterized protein n=1 Tax=Penicillium brevicompactum TaxID=5074 RepID=UPI002540ADAB|nr:uncharacterized protein N7506_003444 [Penicillium brevicompactum]KAJ5343620.1 hypothetical protein N7506_003444 [Penicillium brevicompactum]
MAHINGANSHGYWFKPYPNLNGEEDNGNLPVAILQGQEGILDLLYDVEERVGALHEAVLASSTSGATLEEADQIWFTIRANIRRFETSITS